MDKARSRRPADQLESSPPGGEASSGTGLGLSIVQWIVQAHGGEVRVESALGRGTRFEVRLPLSSSPLVEAASDTDDKSMTKPGGTIHAPVTFPRYTGTAFLQSVPEVDVRHGKDLTMNDLPMPRQASPTFTAFRAVVVCQALVFFVASAIHTGAFGVPSLTAAMIVEGLCGIACVFSAYAIWTMRPWAEETALIVQILILLAVLLGITAVLSDESIRTPINVGLHVVMLVLILTGLSLLAIPGTRAGFGRGKPA
ncbi:MAG: ATP-binding protein [Ktedonobacterales bacterium]